MLFPIFFFKTTDPSVPIIIVTMFSQHSMHLINKGKCFLFVSLFPCLMKKLQKVTDGKGISPEISFGYVTACYQAGPISKIGHDFLDFYDIIHDFLLSQPSAAMVTLLCKGLTTSRQWS